MSEAAVNHLSGQKGEASLGPPKIHKLQTLLGRIFLKVMGWKVESQELTEPKFVALFAPHTSNWDLPIILATIYVLGVKASFLAKKEAFFWPVGGFMRWLGGIPVDRKTGKNTVEQVVDVFNEREQLIMGITPEGTHSKAKYWKTGFYHIAVGAQVPIIFTFLDYERKVGGFGPTLIPSGDIEEDMKVIREFFSGITAKYPHEVGEMVIKPS